MSEPVWLPGEIILAIHDEQIAEHGGLTADDDACISNTVALAAGEIDEHAFADWLRAHTEPS